jgi:hypothetical protein
MLLLPDMMSWQHFVQLPQIRKLSLHEQTQRYNYYLMEQQALIAQVMAQQTVGSGGNKLNTNCIEFVVDTSVGTTQFSVLITSTSTTTIDVNWGDETTSQLTISGETEVTHEYPEENIEYVVSMCFSNPLNISSLDFSVSESVWA